MLLIGFGKVFHFFTQFKFDVIVVVKNGGSQKVVNPIYMNICRHPGYVEQ